MYDVTLLYTHLFYFNIYKDSTGTTTWADAENAELPNISTEDFHKFIRENVMYKVVNTRQLLLERY